MVQIKNLQRDKLDFGNGKISKLFRLLFWPTLVALIFNSLLTVIDGIFIGHGIGADGLASVNIVSPFYNVSIGIGLMFGVGASVIAGIRMSENNIKVACITMTQAFIVGSMLMALICVICILFTKDVVYLLGASPILEDNAKDYLLWMLPGIFLLCVQYVGLMLIRLDGSPKYAMWIQVVAAILNIVLDWYFVFPLRMGTMGAAMATSISCIVGGAMVFIYFLKFHNSLHFYPLKISVTSLLLTLRNTGYMIKIGFATFLTEFTMCIMMLVGNHMYLSMLGEDGVAAFAVACYLFPVVFSIGNASAQSAQPIISYNYGSHQIGRVRHAFSTSLHAAIISGLFVTLMLVIGAKMITGLFLNPSDAAYNLASEGLPYFAICSTFFVVNIAFIGYYQSVEKAVASTIYSLLRGIIFLIPCFLILPRVIGVLGLWLAIPAAEILTCVVIVAVYILKRYFRQRDF